ncbi:hypothetical protein BIU96_03915 [Curtobacterium sp. MCBA15_008]|nr:hypothetical protein BIU96_03915 [Curtobacterium sp. MCBA15_008]
MSQYRSINEQLPDAVPAQTDANVYQLDVAGAWDVVDAIPDDVSADAGDDDGTAFETIFERGVRQKPERGAVRFRQQQQLVPVVRLRVDMLENDVVLPIHGDLMVPITRRE